MTQSEEAEVLAVLESVSGTTKANSNRKWMEMSSHVEFTLPCGWRVTVFNDAGGWDYIDEIVAPDGRCWGYPYNEESPMTEELADWLPARENADAWGIPAEICRMPDPGGT